MKKLHFIQCVPHTTRFWWEIFTQLDNFREFGYSELARILVFIPHNETLNPKWQQLVETFPESRFFFIYDDQNITRLFGIFNYIPILRPWSLSKHFKEYPEIQNDAVFYHDSDILFTRYFDFSPYLQDDVCYLSDTKSYLNSDYFDSKEKDVIPSKLEDYKKRDILNESAKSCGITRQICEENKNCTGGAQSLLKNIDYIFWNNVYDACLELRLNLMNINQQYMRGDNSSERETNGIQSWVADMLGLIWNLWRRGIKTETPTCLDFAWATDEVTRLEEVYIYHNAGITADSKLKRKVDKEEVECNAFYKGHHLYISSAPLTPYDDSMELYIDAILNDPISALYCTHWYTKKLRQTKIKYNL